MDLSQKSKSLRLASAATLMTLGLYGHAYADEYSQKFKSCIEQAGGNADAASTCRSDELARIDAALNMEYKSLSAQQTPYRKELLQKSERVWIQFRDAQCDYEGSQLIGGPLGIQARAQAELRSKCVLRETASRLQTLKQSSER